MANYPTFKLEGTENDYLTSVFSATLWNVSQMPEKLYLRCGNGTLAAIRPKFFTRLKNTVGTHEVFGFEMAGKEGITALRVNTYNGPAILFRSPGDYERWVTTGKGEYEIPKCTASDILRVHGYEWCSEGLLLWYDNHGVPTKRARDFQFRLWTDRDGAHVEHRPTSPDFGTLYRTREECAATLSRVKVIDFDDEPDDVGPKALSRMSAREIRGLLADEYGWDMKDMAEDRGLTLEQVSNLLVSGGQGT